MVGVTCVNPFCLILGVLIWHAPERLPAAAMLLGALLLCVWWFYHRQGRSIGIRVRWTLGLLRCAALAALTISLLQPSTLRPPRPGEQGEIVLLIDRSASMGVCDSQRNTAQLVALANGLGRLPTGARVGEADKLIADVATAKRILDNLAQAQADLNFLLDSGRDAGSAAVRCADVDAQFLAAAHALGQQHAGTRPRNTALVDTLQQFQRSLDKLASPKNHPAVFDAATLDTLRRNLDNIDALADQDLYANDPQVRQVCDELDHLTRLKLVEEAIVHPQTGLLDRLPPGIRVRAFTFGKTASPISLRQLPASADATATDLTGGLGSAAAQLKNVPVEAFILFSDGRDSDSSPSNQAVGPPVFTVAVAPPQTAHFVSIVQTAIPSEVFAGRTFPVQVAVRGWRITAPTSFDVRCALDGVSQVRPITLANDTTAQIVFDARFDSPGVHDVELELLHLPPDLGTGNGTVHARVKTFGQAGRILLLASSPSEDFQNLRDFLGRSPWADLHCELLDSDTAALGLSPSQILEQDVIILMDIAPTALNDAQWRAVIQRVKTGGALLFAAGNDHPPSQCRDVCPEFLPSTDPGPWQSWMGSQPVYHFVPTPKGGEIFKLPSQTAASERTHWLSLAPIYRYWRIATPDPAWDALLVETQSNDPVLLRRNLGSGKVLFLGINEAWRWRTDDAVPSPDFWDLLIHPLIPPPFLSLVDSFGLDASPVQAQPGQKIAVRAGWLDSDKPPPKSLSLQILSSGKILRTQSLSPANPREFVGIIDGLEAGDYELRLETSSESPTCPLHIAPDFSTELSNINGSGPSLARLAASNGGAALTLETLNSLPERLASLEAQRPGIEVPLWNSNYLFIFVVACLAAEWALRKASGLA